MAGSVPPWPCPLCAADHPQPVSQCSACRAVLVLSDFDALLHNGTVNREQVGAAIVRIKKVATQQQNPAVYRHLALAHLNLNEVDQALQALEEARRLQPNNRVWPAIIEILAQRSVKDDASKAIVIPAPRESRPAPVLVVDDSPLQAQFVSRVLEKQGWQVLTASCGEEALRKAEEAGVILLDVFMPGMDGYSVCQRLKENPATVAIPVVMLSGQDVTIDKDRARQVGAADYLTKPCAADVLLRVVEQYGSPLRS